MAGLSTGLKQKMTIYPVIGGSPATADKSKGIEVLINPSGYTRNLRVQYSDRSSLGQPDGIPRFSFVASEELTLPQLVFDGTGVVALIGMKTVNEMIDELLTLIYRVNGDEHQPNVVCFAWGDLMFYGVVHAIDIDYTLFKPSGEPLRAKVKLKVKSTMAVDEMVKRANLSSPDLTHLVDVRAGDTLPLLCNRIYRDPAYYLAVARVNGLVDFRDIKPGMQLRFPPLN